MFTASEKRKENIAEYLLYMWQIEDIIRANDLDIDRIKANVIDRYTGLSDEQRLQMTEWYESLIDMMRREGVAKSGHLQLNRNVIVQLVDLHLALLKDPRFAEYTAEFYRTLPYIVELRAKSGDERPERLKPASTHSTECLCYGYSTKRSPMPHVRPSRRYQNSSPCLPQLQARRKR